MLGARWQSIGFAALLVAAACGGDGRTVDRACDPAAQDDCAAGQKCNPYGPPPPEPWDGTRCVDDNAASGSPAGTPCFTGPEATDTCGPASTCIQLGFGEGVCTGFCTGPDDCAADQRCVVYDDVLGLSLCALACDTAAPDCPLLFECLAVEGGTACMPTARQFD